MKSFIAIKKQILTINRISLNWVAVFPGGGVRPGRAERPWTSMALGGGRRLYESGRHVMASSRLGLQVRCAWLLHGFYNHFFCCLVLRFQGVGFERKRFRIVVNTCRDHLRMYGLS